MSRFSFLMEEFLKKVSLFFVLIVFTTAFCWEAAAAPKPDEYSITVHVSSSQLVVKPAPFRGNYTVQILRVVIRKKYELEGGEGRGRLLALGDYKAKLAEDEHKTTYYSFQIYELLLPDQTTRKFTVVGQSE